MTSLSFTERATCCENYLAKKIFFLLDKKKSILSFSADVTRAQELIELADLLGPEICILKTHIDIIEDFTPSLTTTLKKLAIKHNFFIFEDRKFADIGHTVKLQYHKGIYQIATWADIINAHSLPGPGIIKGLTEFPSPEPRGLLLLAQMSSDHNLFDDTYSRKTLQLAEQYPQHVMGFIAQKKISTNPRWLTMTPGIQNNVSHDHLGQGYITPEKAILENGTDIIIVGRGILKAKDPLAAARNYREISWNAYLSKK